MSCNSEQANKILKSLEPLRAGAALISDAELAQLDLDWKKWRTEWTHRRKTFTMCVHFLIRILICPDFIQFLANGY